jgi:hypothetical protein
MHIYSFGKDLTLAMAMSSPHSNFEPRRRMANRRRENDKIERSQHCGVTSFCNSRRIHVVA